MAIVRNLVAACLILFALKASAGAFHVSLPEISPSWSGPRIENLARATIVDSISREPGRHLILVHYGPDHASPAEWVYNGADIDGSKIVWARDLGPDQNRKLIHYFSDRSIWVVDADAKSPRVQPYSDESKPHDNGSLKSTAAAEVK